LYSRSRRRSFERVTERSREALSVIEGLVIAAVQDYLFDEAFRDQTAAQLLQLLLRILSHSFVIERVLSL